MLNPESEVARLLAQKDLTLGTVESATGGLIAHRLTNVAGISSHFKGSVVAYANETKINVVGVKEGTIKRYGAVSSQVAEQMACCGRQLLGVDICVADTGIAGPGGATPGKPVGLFYIALSGKDETCVHEHNFGGDRLQNKEAAAEAALDWIKKYLMGV